MSYHDFALAIGWAAIAITVWGTLAQFLRVFLVGIEGVSLATWTLFALMGVFWISYGIDQHSLIIVLGSLIILPMQGLIIFRLHPLRSPFVVARSLLFIVVFTLTPTLVFGWSGGIYGTGVAMVLARSPQILELVRERDASGVSVAMWLLGFVGSGGWLVYYQNQHLWAAFTATSFAAIASLSIALLALWRHRQAREVAGSFEVALA